MQPDDLNQDRLLATLPRDKEGRPTIGSISLIRKLGSGGMATVYLGRQVALKRDVAVKILPFTLIEQEPDMVKRFLGEARLAASLESEHIVRVLDVGCEHRTHYFVMQYVQGESVGTFLKRIKKETQEGVPEADAVKIAIAACKGLAAAHAANIVHRDVKPDNILIPSGIFEKAKLADLGLAKPEGSNTTVGTMSHIAMGTPGYMAPEQAENAKNAGSASDVFAMGATIYAMLAGHAPFRGSSLMQTMRAAAQEEHPPLPDTVSVGLRSVVDKCLRKKAKDRYADAKELLAALERVQKDPRAIEPGSRQMRRPPKVAAPVGPKKSGLVPMAIVGVVLAVGAIVAIVMTRHKAPAEEVETSKDDVAALFAQAVRLEKDDRLEDALSTLSRIGGIAPDDPRLATMRSRISNRLASSKSAAQKTEAFTHLMSLADIAKAGITDKPAEWEKLLEIYGRMEPYVQTDEERAKVQALSLEAKARRFWSMARQEEAKGNAAGALEKARQAAAVGVKVPGLDAYLTGLEFRPSAIPEGEKEARLRAFKDFSSRASMERDPASAISLWKQAQANADSPADLQIAVDRIQELRKRLEAGESEKRFTAVLEDALTARQAGDLDGAEAKFREALQLRKDDPAAKEGVAWAEAMRRYIKAMREAETAEGSNDLVHAKEAYERALAAMPNDPAATAKLEALKGDATPKPPPTKLAAFKVVSKGSAHQIILDDAKKISLDFIQLKTPVTFQMGDDPNSRATTLFRSFAMGVTEVTQAQWTVITRSNSSNFKSPDRPVESVSWNEVQEYIDKVNERLAGCYVALPTEAQWEYGCRAGSRGTWCCGKAEDQLKDYAWYEPNSDKQTHPVMTRKPNAFGLFDMHGNVWEFCSDFRSEPMDRRETVEPLGGSKGDRSCRGGAYGKNGWDSRCFAQGWRNQEERSAEIGFRLIFVQGDNPRVPARTSVPLDDAKKTKMEFVKIQQGAFLMGALEVMNDPGVHEVVLRNDFWLMPTEVTQAEWIAVMGPTKFTPEGADLPATNVSWSDIQDFVKRLAARTGKLGKPSLPTEAQWEYACRAGTKTKWYFGDDPGPAKDYGWYYGTPTLQPGGKKKPNAWGIYDMSGNAAEWCQDWFGEYPKGQVVDPPGPRSGKDHVIRGGWYGIDVEDGRCSARTPGGPTFKEAWLGFRVAIPVEK